MSDRIIALGKKAKHVIPAYILSRAVVELFVKELVQLLTPYPISAAKQRCCVLV